MVKREKIIDSEKRVPYDKVGISGKRQNETIVIARKGYPAAA